MNGQIKEKSEQGNQVMVEVNVAKIVKYVCITSVIIVAIVFGSRIFSKIFDNRA